MASRERYSRQQLEEYFDRVCIPAQRRMYDVSPLSDADQLGYLTLLQKHELVKVPWENLTQHYSWHRVVNVKPQHLFRKVVHSSGRGGYCMEANFFFHTVLLSLGFKAYTAGSRIYKGNGIYGGWTHLVNLVTIGDTKYLLDGGFGPQESPRPLALKPGVTETHIAPAQMRVVYESIPQHLDKSQRIWIFQHRFDESKDWAPMYCFTDLEFTPDDIISMNFSPWLNPQSFFTHNVVAVRFSTDKEPENNPGTPGEQALDGEIDGTLSLNQDVLKWRRKRKETMEWKFDNESQRVEALKKYFGIELSDEDIQAIKGTAAEVTAKGIPSIG